MKEVIGLVPAAGRGTRLPGIGCSKEVLSLPQSLRRQGLEVAADALLESYALAGICRAVVLLRPGKEDIAQRLGGRRRGIDLMYEEVGETRSVVDTLAAAQWRAEGAVVALGFPDILLRPRDGFSPLLRRLRAGDAVAVLGLYPNDRPERSDMVEIRPDGSVQRIHVKSADAAPGLAWMTAVWRPRLTRLLVAEGRQRGPWVGEGPERRERQPGDVLNVALEAGLRIETVTFDQGASLDIGTPDGLARAAGFDLMSPASASSGAGDTDSGDLLDPR